MMCAWAAESVVFGFEVDWRFLRLECRWLMGVASNVGEYFRICFVVNAGKVVRNPTAMACTSVESMGENRLAL